MPKHVVITGIAGFIGHHLCEHLLKNTDWNITGIDRLTYAGNLNRLTDLDCWIAERGRVKFVYHDFRAPLATGRIITGGFGSVDYFIHMGAESHVDRSIADAIPFAESNVVGTVHMLNLGRALNVERFILVSTDEVYGASIGGHLHKEGEPHKPGNPYSASKAGSEDFALAYANTYGMPVIITNCFSMDTQLFTPDGFKGYQDIKEGDLVWTLDKNEKLITAPVLEKVRMKSPGNMIHFKANRIDQLVTPNHRMMVRIPHGKPRQYKEIETILADDLLTQPRFQIPLTGKWIGNEDNHSTFDTELLAEILGWYVSEGYTTTGNCVCFGAGTVEQKEILMLLLYRIGLKPYINGRSVRVHDEALFQIVSLFGHGAANKYLPNFVRDWTPYLLNIFLEAAVDGDGSRYGNGMVYYTKSYQLAWQMCELAMKAGYSALLKERFTWNPLKTILGKSYIVRISAQQGTLEKININKVSYDDDVWCVRTATGRVFASRNGTISLSGQTMNNFGERQDIEKFVPKVIRAIYKHEPVTAHVKKIENKTVDISSRCWLHARNHADALLFLLDKGITGERYNIVGEKHDVIEMIYKINKYMDKPYFELVEEDFHSFRKGHDMHYGLDGTKLSSLGWKPKFTLEKSLERTVKWSLDHKEWLEL